MNMLNRRILLAVTAVLIAPSVAAYELIPQQEGLHGFVNLGVSGSRIESNLIASMLQGEVDVGKDTISDITSSPDSESFAGLVFGFELSYVFNDAKTQVFVGNLLEDYIRLDFSTRVGIRHYFDGVGIIGVSALQSPMINSVKVWVDPYVVDEKRRTVDRDSSGVRLSWEGVMGTQLELHVSSREIEIDNERSGEFLEGLSSLSAADRLLLNRNGDINSASARYTHRTSDKNAFLFDLSVTEHDLDGDAMSYDGAAIGFTHLLSLGEKNRLVTNLHFSNMEYDKTNPIYAVKDELDRAGLSIRYFQPNAFGLNGWTFNVGVAYVDEDHDIDFYDSTYLNASAAMLKRF